MSKPKTIFHILFYPTYMYTLSYGGHSFQCSFSNSCIYYSMCLVYVWLNTGSVSNAGNDAKTIHFKATEYIEFRFNFSFSWLLSIFFGRFCVRSSMCLLASSIIISVLILSIFVCVYVFCRGCS